MIKNLFQRIRELTKLSPEEDRIAEIEESKIADLGFGILYLVVIWLMILIGCLTIILPIAFLFHVFGAEIHETEMPILIFYSKAGIIPYAIVVIFTISSFIFEFKSNLLVTKRKRKKGYRLRVKYKRSLKYNILGRIFCLFIFPIFWLPLTLIGLFFWASYGGGKSVDGFLYEERTWGQMIADSFFGKPPPRI